MRSKKLIRGSFLNTVDLIVQIAAGFYLMPLMIRAFGDAGFGVWVLAVPFMGYAGGFDLGLYSAVIRFISQAIGKGGPEADGEVKTVAATAFYLFLFLALLSTFVVFAAVLGAPFFLHESAQIDLFRKVLLILCLHNWFVYPAAVFEGALRAHLRYDLAHTVKILCALLRVIVTTALIRNHCGLIAVVWATAGCGIVDGFAQTLLACSLEKRMSVLPRYFHWARARQMFGYGFYAIVGRIGDLLRFQADSFVITLFSGVGLVTPYRIASRVNECFHQFMGGITGVFNPYFSQKEGSNDFKAIVEKFFLITKVTTYLSSFIGVMLVLFGRDFIERWIGPGYEISYKALLILTLPTILALAQGAIFPLLYGISKHKFIAYVSVGEGFLNLALSILLVQKMGILGVALGTAIPILITAVFIQPVYVARILQIPLRSYCRAFLVPLFKSAAALLVPWLLMGQYSAPTYPSIITLAIVQTAIFIIFLFYFGFGRHEREYLAGIFKRGKPAAETPCV